MAWLYKLLNENGKQSQLHDIAEYVISAVICLNIVLIVFESGELGSEYQFVINILRWSFFAFFLIEYILRLCIADIVMNDKLHPVKSRIRYIFTPRALINLFALLPVLLGGAVIDFRIFRALRLLRITQIKSLRRQTNILIRVLKLKGAQLLSSLFIVFISMLISGVVICDLESKVQPDVFNNILTGFWWSVSAFTTIGYGDIYPLSPAGKIFGSFVSIFGIFLMAIPIGILTSGFFEISKKVDPEPDDIE